MDLSALGLAEYWHERHAECLIDADCRMQCVLLALADSVTPEEPEPGADATMMAYSFWLERMRIRRLLLEHVH